ncbi:MAG TPA: hypothetical protein VME41_10345 [Stellaceae bacterium]|nr:hypothetical protein [Stellaceae bacterium]
MIEVPKLVLILLIGFLVWYAMRWVNGAAPKMQRRGPARPPPRQQAIEDLVACDVCGAYVAAGAPACGKPGCPRPR